MATYLVTIPIAGHLMVEVEATSESEAKDLAFDEATLDQHLGNWEMLDRFNQGNVCYCPSPWAVEVERVEDEETP